MTQLDEVLRFLEDGQPHTCAEIEEGTGILGASLYQALSRLKGLKLVTSEERGIYKILGKVSLPLKTSGAIVQEIDSAIQSPTLDTFARAFRADIPVTGGHITLIVPDRTSSQDIERVITMLKILIAKR